MKLENRTAFITGAASGLGAEIARAFAREGARVFVTDVDGEGAERVARECAGITAGARSARCDVSDSSSVGAAFRSFDDALGALDVLVNNAGIVHRVPEYVERVRSTMEAQLLETMAGEGVKTHAQFVEGITDEMFDRMLKIHLYGTFYCTREALPRMRAHGGGRIVNMGSIMGSASLA